MGADTNLSHPNWYHLILSGVTFTGKRCEIAQHIASQDAEFKSLFYDDKWLDFSKRHRHWSGSVFLSVATL